MAAGLGSVDRTTSKIASRELAQFIAIGGTLTHIRFTMLMPSREHRYTTDSAPLCEVGLSEDTD
jgi:hypothetical protein